MKYGAPYMGSKSKIAEWVVSNLPEAESLYDLFAGGCAVTHCALLSGKYSHIYANDIGGAPEMFLDAVNGKYRNMTRWVTREEFYAEKESDPYVKWCWSFGNNGRDYMYSRKIEDAKHALHMLVFFNDSSEYEKLTGLRPGLKGDTPMERYADYHRFYRENFSKRGEYTESQSIEAQARLASLDKLQSLLKFKRLCSAEDLAEYSRLQSAEASSRLESLERTRQRAVLGADRLQSLSRLCQLELLNRTGRLAALESVRELETAERQERLVSLGEQCGKQLQPYERTKRQASLNGIDSGILTVTRGDYRDVEIKPDSIVYCFDKNTEVLTDKGWKNVADVTLQDKCLSREPATARLEFVDVIRLISYHYKGKMYEYKGKNTDLCVTPNHRLFISKGTTRENVYNDKFVQASDIFKNSLRCRFISAGGKWQEDIDKYVFICGEKFLKEDFAYLLGIFLTDGCVNCKGSITISQTKPNIIKKITDILKKLGISHNVYNMKNRNAKTFYICRKYLPFFQQFYKKEKRKIPADIKNWGIMPLQRLLEGAIDGDSDNERRKIICGSKSLVDDFQEILYKCGFSGDIKTVQPRPSYLKSENRYIIGHKPYYILSVNHKPYLTVIKNNQHMVEYDDVVNCITLSKWHTVLVRRNGKPIWCGQCDIPYNSTNGYTGKSKHSKAEDGGFDHKAFYEWVKRQKSLVVVSEYSMPDNFVCVASIKKMQTMCATKTTERTEKMFVHESQIEMYNEMMGKERQGKGKADADGGLWLFPEMMTA